MADQDLATLSINTIRTLSIDAIQKANSGHPGLPLGAAPMAYVLWQNHLKHDPKAPAWADRDRFVLSAGHGSMLLYSLLHLTGYGLEMSELEDFRQWDSRTPGHPESTHTPGVEATTGPLGQGSVNAVGMAMAERFLANRYNKPGHDLFDHYTYALVSDGDLMEGLAAEAASMAGQLGLGKLIYLYDANDITLEGPTSLCFSVEDLCKRYEAYGWHVLRVEDGNTDLDAIDAAINEAKAVTDKPSIIYIHTTIGFGSPNKAGSAKSHGSPLGVDEVALTKKALGWDPEAFFHVPAAVADHMGAAVGKGEAAHGAWKDKVAAYAEAHPALAAELDLCLAGTLPDGWDSDLPAFAAGESIATRSAAGKALNAIATKVPWLLGGDADLGGSTKTILAGEDQFDGQTGAGRNVRFGVREHAMGAICNGLQYHGGVKSFSATFFVFSDYMRPAVRLAAMNNLPTVYVWTHDSIGLGEDGPTHQPVEHLASLRTMPNLAVVRPCDGNEAVEAWRYAMQRSDGPTALVLSRQNLPVLDRSVYAAAAGLQRGAYVLADSDGAPDAIVIATGSEVTLALGARDVLAKDGVKVRVVSMPCWRQFASESADYRDSVLPAAVRARVSVEAGVGLGWERWVGSDGAVISLERFGSSAPGATNFEKLGFTVDAVVAAVRQQLG